MGAVSGAVGAAWAFNKVREARGPEAADRLAGTVVSASRKVGGRVRDAVAEGVQTMREANAEMEDLSHPSTDRPRRRVPKAGGSPARGPR